MKELFYQHEMVRGTTHWIAWFDEDTLSLAMSEGFTPVHSYWGTPMVKNDDGRLVPP